MPVDMRIGRRLEGILTKLDAISIRQRPIWLEDHINPSKETLDYIFEHADCGDTHCPKHCAQLVLTGVYVHRKRIPNIQKET